MSPSAGCSTTEHWLFVALSDLYRSTRSKVGHLLYATHRNATRYNPVQTLMAVTFAAVTLDKSDVHAHNQTHVLHMNAAVDKSTYVGKQTTLMEHRIYELPLCGHHARTGLYGMT